MFEEIKNNKWTILLVIVIFAILEIQLVFLSNQTKNVFQNSSANSKPVSKAIPISSLLGKVKKIEGNNIILSLVASSDEVRVKTTPDTKIYQQIMRAAGSEPSSKNPVEATFSDIGIGDIIMATPKESIKEKATVIDAKKIGIISKNQP